MADGSKTEKATPKKRRDERKKGNVFMSKDAVAMATLIGAYAMLKLLSGTIVEGLGGFMEETLAAAGQKGLRLEDVLNTLEMNAMMVMLKTVGLIAIVVVVCAVGATFAQTKLLVSGEALKPKFSRINPLEGFKRLFSLKSVVEAAKGILKITILLVIVYQSIRDMFNESARYLYADIGIATAHIFDKAMSLILKISIAFAVLAALDFFYQWWDYERQLKMSKQEIKEEYKQTEGNPQIKSKIRELQRRMSQSRMMQQVPDADVVIRNPTHYAVALRYDPERDFAPLVLAMGQNELALRIVSVAEENKVAVVENPPLARQLYASTDVGQMIPQELYEAVAEVLVYIFKLNNDKRLQRRK